MENLEVYKDRSGQWRWKRLVNGEIVSVSGEGYVNKSHAVEMASKLNPDLEPEVE